MLSLDGLPTDKSEDIKLLESTSTMTLFSRSIFNELCIKTSRKVGILSRLRNLIPSKANLFLYKAFILPHLTYCHLIWHFRKSIFRQKKKVERIQERALTAIYRSHSDTYEELLERANLPTLYNIDFKTS